MSEVDAVIRRYATRGDLRADSLYSMLRPEVSLGVQERQRALLSFLATFSKKPLCDLQVLEIGCGRGSNLLELLRIGCNPCNLTGNELLPDRLSSARINLPEATRLIEGDASKLDIDANSMDIVYQSTVFTSLLDDNFQDNLARKMWSWVRPGGAILWYDFVYNNPRNSDVRGVPLARVKKLFPKGCVHVRRVTLAPPISRRICRIHPSLYAILNATPLLRTHLLCWIQKT